MKMFGKGLNFQLRLTVNAHSYQLIVLVINNSNNDTGADGLVLYSRRIMSFLFNSIMLYLAKLYPTDYY